MKPTKEDVLERIAIFETLCQLTTGNSCANCTDPVCRDVKKVVRALIASHAEPRRVTREDVRSSAEKFYSAYTNAPAILIDNLYLLLSDLGLEVEEWKKEEK